MFERDLRLAAKSMCVRISSARQQANLGFSFSPSGLKFDSSGMYVHLYLDFLGRR